MMNKHQEAWKVIKHTTNYDVRVFDDSDEEIRLIQELVDKATPKKVVKWLNDRSMACCPICHSAEYAEEMPKHCRYCGQALDWSEE